MKYSILTLFVLLTGYSVFAQTNTFPANGNVGIGTLNPQAKVEINSGTGITPLKAVGSRGYILVDNVGSGESYYNASKFHQFQGTNGTPILTMLGTGNIGIGTTMPDTKLTVNGTIHSKEVKVDMTGFPDYVFKPDYPLLPLIEVKAFINQNHHLPEIPSEREVIKEGINLGEMNKVLVKKIEELTLYLIQQKEDAEKQTKILQEQIDELKKGRFKSI